MFTATVNSRCYFIQPLRWLFLLSFMVMLDTGYCAADRSLRCDGRLVSIGAFKEQVEGVCGAPGHIEQWEEGPNKAFSQLYDYKTEHHILPRLIFGPLRMERWTYDFGSNRLIHYLHFQNGQLIRIETGERGRK